MQYKKNLKVLKGEKVLEAFYDWKYDGQSRANKNNDICVKAWCPECHRFNLHGMRNPKINSITERVGHCNCVGYWLVYRGKLPKGGSL